MTDPNAPHQDDELLTSYLDGELSEDERRFVQNRLIDDPDLRRRLSDLQQAWDLLDDLPESTANQEFTKSTLELVTLGAEKGWEAVSPSGNSPSLWFRGARLIAVLFAGAVSIGILGGAGVRYFGEREELKRLDVIAYLPGLKAAEEMEVVRALAEIPDLEFAANSPELFEDKVISAIPDDLSSRREWVDKLSTSQQSLLYTYNMQLQDMRPSERDQLSQLANEIAKEKESQKYKNAIAIVGAIYNEKPSEMVSLKATSEVPRSSRIRQSFYRRLGEWYFHELAKKNADDNEVIQSWFRHQTGDPDLGPKFAAAFQQNLSPTMRRTSFREILNGLTRDLAQGTYVDPNGKKLSDLSQRILSEVDPQEQAKFLTDCYFTSSRFSAFSTELSFEKVFDAYSGFDQATRDRLDLTTFEEIKRHVWNNARRPRPGSGPPPSRPQ